MKKKRIVFIQSVFILIFLLLLFLPGFQKKYSLVSFSSLNENREKISKPEGGVLRNLFLYGQDYSKKYEEYYNDNYGFRDFFVRLDSFIKFKYFHLSSTPKVLIGKNDWLYLSADDAIESYCSERLFSENELIKWKTLFEKRAGWLKDRNIEYIFLIAPNKHTIYPEFLPDYIVPVNRVSRLDQLISYLRKNSSFKMIDPRNLLWEKKDSREVYFHTDSHWNQYGAFLVFRELVSRLKEDFPGVYIPDLEDFEVVETEKSGGGTARMLGLEDLFLEKRYSVRFADGFSVRKLSSLEGGKYEVYESSFEKALPVTVVVYHDSFTQGLKPFFSKIFFRTVYINTPFDFINEEIIEKEKPAIVIQEMAERHLEKSIPNIF